MIQIVLLNIESSRIAIKMYANVDFVLLFLDIHDIMYLGLFLKQYAIQTILRYGMLKIE